MEVKKEGNKTTYVCGKPKKTKAKETPKADKTNKSTEEVDNG